MMRLAGAFVACAIGSGFATGQEVLQFFSLQGIMSIVGTLITTVLFSVCGALFMRHGFVHALKTPTDVCRFYFGKRVGVVVEIVFQLFLFSVFVIMISGAGATLFEIFGIPAFIGRIVMSVAVLVTVVLGLSKLTDILGSIGPIIIVATVVIGIMSLFSGSGTILENANEAAQLDLPKTHGGWLWSSVLYPSFNAVVVLFLSCTAGSTAKSAKEAVGGGILGGVLFGAAVMVLNLGLIGNIKEVGALSVPTLALASKWSPILAVIFAIIICLGVYTTAVPMLWGVVRHFAEDRTKKSIFISIGLAVLGCVLAMTDFKVLVNIIYPFSGYVGLALIVILVIRELFDHRKSARKAPEMSSESAAVTESKNE